MKLRWKLSTAQKEELEYLYIYKGWRNRHLSRKFNLAHQSVHYRTKGLVRLVPVLPKDQPPAEILHLYKTVKERPKSYADYLRESQNLRLKARLSAHSIFLTGV